MSTCQICGRTIKAKTGKIANHGYERPGGGWQTASCMGAQYLPYEESCDRIPAVIEMFEKFIADTAASLDELRANPPESFTGMDHNRRPYTVEKPANFDPSRDGGAYRPRSYEGAYFGKKRELESSIKFSRIDLKFLQKRLEAWVAPAE